MNQATEAAGARKPRYQELADELRAEIVDGVHASGEAFPTESALCARYAVSRFTVRAALRALEVERLIDRRRGFGTKVRPPAARGASRQHRLSTFAEILDFARNTDFRFTFPGDARLPRRVADHAGLTGEPPWIHFKGVRSRNGEGPPIAVTEGYIHPDLRKAADGLRNRDMALFRQLELDGAVRFARLRQDMQAAAAGRTVAAGLNVPVRSPCLRVTRCYVDVEDRIRLISVSWHPAERFVYSMEIAVAPM